MTGATAALECGRKCARRPLNPSAAVDTNCFSLTARPRGPQKVIYPEADAPSNGVLKALPPAQGHLRAAAGF
jgi:hypothetical protein